MPVSDMVTRWARGTGTVLPDSDNRMGSQSAQARVGDSSSEKFAIS